MFKRGEETEPPFAPPGSSRFLWCWGAGEGGFKVGRVKEKRFVPKEGESRGGGEGVKGVPLPQSNLSFRSNGGCSGVPEGCLPLSQNEGNA